MYALLVGLYRRQGVKGDKSYSKTACVRVQCAMAKWIPVCVCLSTSVCCPQAYNSKGVYVTVSIERIYMIERETETICERGRLKMKRI